MARSIEKGGVTRSFHNGIEYCECFIHCSCLCGCIDSQSGVFPSDKPQHPEKAIDQAWHELLKGIQTAKKVGPYFTLEHIEFRDLVGYNYHSDFQVHFLSEYLDTIERFKRMIVNGRLKCIDHYHRWYSSPNEREQLEENLARNEQQYKSAIQILDELPSKIVPLYRQALNTCIHNIQSTLYQRGLIYSLEGQWELALTEIRKLIESVKTTRLTSEIYQACGEACLEVNFFHEAIDALTTAIEKNPQNKEAHFLRASAYFETGNFEEALKDYLTSDRGSGMVTRSFVSKEFTTSLLTSTCEGAIDGAIEFIPSLCHTVYGLGRTLWITAQQPLESAQLFSSACYEMGESIVDYCKTVDQETLNGYVDQIKALYERYDVLSEAEKGELIGYTVGKFGVDLFAGAGIVKCVSKYKALKNANRACNMEAMLLTQNEDRAVITYALKHASERDAYLKNVPYNFNAHNKHVLGHNDCDGLRSIWNHPDPEGLLRKVAGKGNPERGILAAVPAGNDVNSLTLKGNSEKSLRNGILQTPYSQEEKSQAGIAGILGQSGYKETVDFGEYIGTWKSVDGKTQMPTTRGTIHYGKKGAHIVPSNPNPIIGS
jgi:tetratricopeptide (TPR) repeat protein